MYYQGRVTFWWGRIEANPSIEEGNEANYNFSVYIVPINTNDSGLLIHSVIQSISVLIWSMTEVPWGQNEANQPFTLENFNKPALFRNQYSRGVCRLADGYRRTRFWVCIDNFMCKL